MISKKKINTGIRYLIKGLPLAAIIYSSFLPLQPTSRHLLVAAALIWIQIFMILEVFAIGK